MDAAPVRRLPRRRRQQRLLPPPARRRRAGLVGGLRPADPPRLRRRRSAHRSRCRARRRVGVLRRRHGPAVRRHPARSRLGVDDDERRGAAGARRLRARGRGAGRAGAGAARHDPERHPQGVPGAQCVDSCAGAVAAHRARCRRMAGRACAALQRAVGQRLPLPGNRRRCRHRTGADLRQRPRLPARPARAATPSMQSAGASASSSVPAWISTSRSPSCAPRAWSGPASSRPRADAIRRRARCACTARPAAGRSPPASRTTT